MLTRVASRSRSRPTSSSLIPDPALKGSRGASKPGTRRFFSPLEPSWPDLFRSTSGITTLDCPGSLERATALLSPKKPCAFAGMMNEILGFISGQLLSVLSEQLVDS